MAKEKPKKPIPWRLLLTIAFWMVIAVAGLIGARRVEAYVESSPQFQLGRTRLNGSDGILLEGLQFAPRSKVLRVFAADIERSVLLTPLAERRRRLLAVDWVEDAIVSRVWPNRIWVRIKERVPVAFVNVPLSPTRAVGSKVALIDANGVILEQPPKAKFAFPVLTGVAPEQPEALRRRRVQVMLELLEELGPAAGYVSEVDTATLDNLSIVAQVDGTAVELMLGDTNFARRFQNFAANFAEIRKRSPGAKAFDLRLEDRITSKE